MVSFVLIISGMNQLTPDGWYNQRLADGGPVYMETHPERWIVEPWNAITSLLILIPAFYWLIKVYNEHKRSGNVKHNSPVLLYVVIFLVITGGIGSTLFHAFRAYPFFLFMDVLPSAILTVTLAIYFWIKVLPKWWYVFFIYLPLFGLRFLFWNKLPDFLAINLSYFLTGFTVGLPLIIYQFKTGFRGWVDVAAAIGLFGLALLFRQLDSVEFPYLYMGTHFLWHTFAAIGAYFILKYLYNIRSANT